MMQELFPAHYDRMGFVSFLLATLVVFVVAIVIRDAASVNLNATRRHAYLRDRGGEP